MNAADPALAGLRPPVQSPAQSTTQSTAQSADKGDTAARPRRGDASGSGAPAGEDFDAMMAEDTAAGPKAPAPVAVPAGGEPVRSRGRGVPGDLPMAKQEEEDGGATVAPTLALPLSGPVPVESMPAARDVAGAAAAVATMATGSQAAQATVPIVAEGAPEVGTAPSPDPAQPSPTAPAAAAAAALAEPGKREGMAALADVTSRSAEGVSERSRTQGPRDAAAESAPTASAAPQATPAPAAPTAGAAAQAVTLSPLLAMPSWQLAPQAPAPSRARVETGSLPAGAVPEAVAGQVALAIAKGGGGRKVELRLDPPELGRVEIHLSPAEKGGLHAVVIAERADTHELLRRHGEMLARELSSAGYADVSLSFSSGSDAPADRDAAGRLPTASAFAAVAEDGFDGAAAVPARSLPLADGGLDIRL